MVFDHPKVDPRMSGMPPRHHSVGDYEHMRPGSGSSLQSFYANQRHQPRQSEAEQMMQTKRRMAAQRERELRNYHQEQQYNRRESYFLLNYSSIGLPRLTLQNRHLGPRQIGSCHQSEYHE